MKTTIVDFVPPGTSFGPDDLAEMQQIFDEACIRRELRNEGPRTTVAIAIFSAYQAGERNRQTLFRIANGVTLWAAAEPTDGTVV